MPELYGVRVADRDILWFESNPLQRTLEEEVVDWSKKEGHESAWRDEPAHAVDFDAIPFVVITRTFRYHAHVVSSIAHDRLRRIKAIPSTP